MNLSTLKLAGVSFLVSKSLRANRRQLRSDVTVFQRKYNILNAIQNHISTETNAANHTYWIFVPSHPFAPASKWMGNV